jgi:hypothetical protein
MKKSKFNFFLNWNIDWHKKMKKFITNLKFISGNVIDSKGAAILGEYI